MRRIWVEQVDNLGRAGSPRRMPSCRTIVALGLCLIADAADFAPVYNVKTYGATAAGAALDTAAIQRTIDGRSAAGGGFRGRVSLRGARAIRIVNSKEIKP